MGLHSNPSLQYREVKGKKKRKKELAPIKRTKAIMKILACLLFMFAITPTIWCKKQDIDRSEKKENLTLGHYNNSEITLDSKMILKAYNLEFKRMVRDKTAKPTSIKISWSQISRCWTGCSEDYLLVDYYENGDTSNPVMKVYVAKNTLTPPDEFSTGGYKNLLHFGFLYYGDKNKAIFFVLQPKDWKVYQHRFKTNAFTAFFKKSVEEAAKKIGNIVGGWAGNWVGSEVSTLIEGSFGDYLRYIG